MINNAKELILTPSSMRPPSWRWLVILEYLADLNSHFELIKNDPFLTQGISFYKSRKLNRKSPEFYLKNYLDITRAFQIYAHNKPNGWRWVIEALLLTGASPEDISKSLKLPTEITPEIIKCYSKLFFDVTDYLVSEPAVTANILGVSPSVPVDFCNFDYVWKRFAYTFGVDPFIGYFGSKKRVRIPEYDDWVRDLAKDTMSDLALQVMNDRRLCFNDVGIKILQTAKDFWILPKDAEKTVQDTVMKSFIDQVGGCIDVSLMSATLKP